MFRARTAMLVVVTVQGCVATPETSPRGSASPAAATSRATPPADRVATASSAAPPPGTPVPAPAEPVAIVADPAVLAALQAGGFDVGTTIADLHADSTKSLGSSPAYRVVTHAIAADLAGDRARDPAAGVGMRFLHRQFDARWLDSNETRFELVSVVNRLDRRPFAPAHCGEVRFIYRLAYRVQTKAGAMDSRLPMTVNVVEFQEPAADGTCTAVARSWMRPADVRERDGEATWLVSDEGPLGTARRKAWTPKSVEVNFQSVRWPSTVRPSMAGHAEYVLRVFHRTEKAPYLAPAPLENTIDVARLAHDAALRNDLVRVLGTKETLAALDRGTLVVPERFLATKAVSVSPHGLARRANRLYSSALPDGALHGVDLTPYATIRTETALVRRLDALSCPGCHQSRSIAGFHLLGVEPKEDVVDALEVPMSPHLHAELARRAPYIAAVAEGRAPDESRPSPEHAPSDGGLGARCGLGDPGFSSWTCAPGLTCVKTFDKAVGECETAGGPSVGGACETGSIAEEVDAHRDTARLVDRVACGSGVCEENAVGFPGGMCSGACDALPPGAACGGIALLTEFNACLAAGTAFDRCLAEHTRPGALRACGFHAPCRDDYVCARGPNGGTCIPPYFTFQLRVDGHPL